MDPDKAWELLEPCARDGHLHARHRIGKMLMTGWKGRKPDPVAGLMWLKLAADRLNPEGVVDFQKFSAKQPKETVKQAARLARKWEQFTLR